MGGPVRIVELARQIIRLAGLKPDKEIEIRFTGLRPGEKLHEELFHDSAAMMPTGHPGLKLAAPRPADAELLARSHSAMGTLWQHGHYAQALRSEDRRVGKRGVCRCRS